jgi:hypothetical protein
LSCHSSVICRSQSLILFSHILCVVHLCGKKVLLYDGGKLSAA